MKKHMLKHKILRYFQIKKALREVDELNERLLREKEVRQEFFANASHELKTPITSIRGYAELLESGLVTDEETRQDMIRRIRSEADHMTALIADILEVSKLESDEAKPEIMRVDVSALIRESMERFLPRANEARVTLHNYTGEGVYVYANYGQMEEIVSNLISNAIRYNKKAGKVWVNACNESSCLILRVRDSGIGIPAKERDKIFNRFYRVDKGRSRASGGTGLGLSIVKHILNYYGGKIEVHSKMGEGTEFVVKMPVKS